MRLNVCIDKSVKSLAIRHKNKNKNENENENEKMFPLKNYRTLPS